MVVLGALPLGSVVLRGLVRGLLADLVGGATRAGGDPTRVLAQDLRPRLVGGDDVGVVGVVRHVEDPARPDQVGHPQAGAVGLFLVLVEPEDLGVAAAVAEALLGDLPEALVVAAVGWLHDVHLLHARRVRLLLVLVGDRRGEGDDSHGRRGGRRHAEARDGHGHGSGGEQQQDRRDQPVGQRLGRPGERHTGWHSDPAHPRVHLDHDARDELQPSNPHEQDKNGHNRRRPDTAGEQVQVEQFRGDGRPGKPQQRVRHTTDERNQNDQGPEPGSHVPRASTGGDPRMPGPLTTPLPEATLPPGPLAAPLP
ncbi:hypothetical protein GCM10010486_66330 [Nonomuraea roseoviolacea subsp. carminata]